MIQKLLFTFMLFSCGVTYLFAQTTDTPNYARLTVESVAKTQRMVADSVAKYDNNGDALAKVIVESTLDNLEFEGGGIFRDDNGNADVKKSRIGSKFRYEVGLIQDYSSLTVKHNDYAQSSIELSSNAKPKEIWRVIVSPIEAAEIEMVKVENDENYNKKVRFKTDTFSTLLIDDKRVSKPSSEMETISLEEGSHYFTSEYKGNKYDQKINVNKDNILIDARFGGEVTIKNGKNIEFDDYGNPTPRLIENKGHTEKYDNLYGEYKLFADPTGISIIKVKKKFNIGSRGNKTFYIDEMVPYFFMMYHGTTAQPLGLSLGFCQRFGLMVSYSTNIVTKVNTTFGESKVMETFENKESHTSEKKSWSAATNLTVSGGPVWRFYRKFYLIIEAGGSRYVSTKEPKILDPDFTYKWGLSLSGKLMWRFKSLLIGAGYTYQKVDHPYDPNISNMFNFSAGLAF